MSLVDYVMKLYINHAANFNQGSHKRQAKKTVKSYGGECTCTHGLGGVGSVGWHLSIYMSSYRYMKSNCGNETAMGLSYIHIHNGISCIRWHLYIEPFHATFWMIRKLRWWECYTKRYGQKTILSFLEMIKSCNIILNRSLWSATELISETLKHLHCVHWKNIKFTWNKYFQ